jgi:gluconolactonase
MKTALFALFLAGALGTTGSSLAMDIKGAPAASVDLATTAGTRAVQGQWRYSDVQLVETTFRDADGNGQPTGARNHTWDIKPRAGASEFDDADWLAIEPETLAQRRGAGLVSFNWYRIRLTIPKRVDGFDTSGSTVVFSTSLDDYAEIWVDGELPRATGQLGGSVVAGWNASNQLVVARDAKPGQQIQLAVFGINGPISDAPTNYIWMRSARLDFYPGTPQSTGPQAVVPQEVNVRVERLDPAIDRIVPPNAKLYKLAEGFQFIEGPVWLPQGELLFSDPNHNTIYRYVEPGKLSVYREHSGYSGADIAEYGQPGSNGLTLDPQGRLTINEHGNHRVTRLEPGGELTVLADNYDGKRLNSPNDLVYRSDGVLYFTDPPFGLPKFFDDPRRELP